MTSIGDKAKAYKPPQTKNIADLEVVNVNTEIIEREYLDKEGKPFVISVITIDNEDYRVPVSVLKALKTIQEDKPELKHFKVKKSGEGLNTEYVVIPIEH